MGHAVAKPESDIPFAVCRETRLGSKPATVMGQGDICLLSSFLGLLPPKGKVIVFLESGSP